ncbi:DsbA family protein [Streptomyces sp. BI20]|uniref:mycothiol-dependent nitroreductase Rv2466c family protein n=1 Tax=Streptomyces sp. BI20 TaxID=3403460 RepID=UPI003C767675
MSETQVSEAQVPEKTVVDFWFDPICPWAWMTSRWVLEVEKLRDIRVRWNVMSLAVLNEARVDELPEYYREIVGPKGLAPVRVATAVAQKYDDETVGRLYTALGTRIHNGGEGYGREVIVAALADAGLPAELIEAADTDAFDTALRASHADGIERVGQEVGTPIISVPGADGEDVAFFGPVVTPIPRGDAAARLWDGTLLVASVPGFYEIKRTRTADPSFE